jgi:hypothetical protein
VSYEGTKAIIVTLLLSLCLVVESHARLVQAWSYDRLNDKATLVGVAIPTKVVQTFEIFAAFGLSQNLRADNTNKNVGAWSEAVNGLRGRLIITQEKEDNGVQRPKVFLELQNVAGDLSPLQINGFNPQTSFQCRVFDSAKNTVGSNLGKIREMQLPAFTLVVPFESSLRLNVNRHNPGAWGFLKAPPKERIEIVLGAGIWTIEKGNRADYFLEGTFHIEEAKPATPLNWAGTLEIPRVKIPR